MKIFLSRSWFNYLFFFISLIATAVAVRQHSAGYLADDGGFFLKYAENIANGNGWRFNATDPAPVWGASAPFWPLVLVLPHIIFKMNLFDSAVWMGTIFTSLAVAVTAVTLATSYSILSGFFFLLVCLFQHQILYQATGALESPLSILLIAVGFWSLVTSRRLAAWVYVLIAFFLLNNKIDYLPIGFAYLICVYLLKKEKKEFIGIFGGTVALTAVWVLFTYIHFGSVLPNSFLRKLNLSTKIPTISRKWFAEEAFVVGGQIYITYLAALGLAAFLFKKRNVTLYFLAIASHSIAYTLLPPTEPFAWYLIPTLFASLILASIPFSFTKYFTLSKKMMALTTGTLLILLIAIVKIYGYEENKIKPEYFARGLERDRTEAGQWIAKNMPQDYTVMAYFGNVAYWSQRYSYDGTFLNRSIQTTDMDILNGKISFNDKYQPHINVVCPYGNEGGVEEVTKRYAFHYRAVKVFSYSRSLVGEPFFCVVAIREDLPYAVSPADIVLSELKSR